ncbi:tetratricopeptide repeat protein [Tsuneonella mangrovi]|uniref:tetratricopeptide repeat protein n=1 Tax=Tsuneonella mangrovi TaxID=1982042 RepID=UPI000BA1F96E|nr:tetratricopeptide repeat protein [Tsuneonella mangrovi]
MRFAAPATAVAMVFALTASMGQGADRVTDPRAVALLSQGRAALDAGQTEQAIDAFEAALAVDPGSPEIFNDLGDAARINGLQGKAIRYYRDAMRLDPKNLEAISGEGTALVEKGAVEKANRNLAKLETLCGPNCPATRQLAAAIAKGPQQRILTAEAVMPDSSVTQQN